MKIKLLALFFLIFGCDSNEVKDTFEDQYIWDSMHVTATAYNSLAYQTSSDPHITAWGDSIRPGLKYIAVSRDLLKSGLKYNTPVKIEGFDGVYFVKDKMHYRWRKRIDIYMGLNVKAAKAWGRRKVCIDYGIAKTD
ncbi:3D domain-containing protein [Changchengzhania lutea]|uniref:3D domain-containing protein n=1 Tax=Changchengzhania lutea TaxID=2049305 RepID=UPI001FE5B85C|nr:3D domain-containing protein [Changchengzhania lutea]